MLFFNNKDIETILFNNEDLNTIVFNNEIIWRKNLFLYNLGDECYTITGGYGYIGGQNAMEPTLSGWNNGVEFNKTSSSLHLGVPDDAENRIGCFHTNYKIDITNYNKLYVLVDIYMGNTEVNIDIPRYASVIIGDYLFLMGNQLKVLHWLNIQGSTYQTLLEIDISDISGSHYIQFYVSRDANYGAVHYRMDFAIYKAWLSY